MDENATTPKGGWRATTTDEDTPGANEKEKFQVLANESREQSAVAKKIKVDPYGNPGSEIIVIEVEEKESVASKCSYLLLLIGNAVGFGNIWRFPYLLNENGGVVFLIPYCFMLATLGIPMFVLEIAIGQRIHKTCLKTWNDVSPYLAGIGVACGLICLIVGFYYITLIAWCLRYTASVFREPLPWKDCIEAELACRNPHTNETGREDLHCSECEQIGASKHYWYNNVLTISSGIGDPGRPGLIFNAGIATSLIVSWLIIWCILVKGLRSTGKVVYFTALFPYFVLVSFFIRGVLLDNMKYGYEAAFTPDWTKLTEIKVWFAAGTQIFFSLSLGFGLLVSFSALNPANNNCYRDAILVTLINCSTSLFAAMVIYPILGFKGSADFQKCVSAARLNQNITNATIFSDEYKVMYKVPYLDNGTLYHVNETKCDRLKFITDSASGTGLVFIIFTEAMTKFPPSQLWAFLFFLMLLTLGIGSGFTTVEGVVAPLHEMLIKFNIKKWKVTTGVCLVSCAFSMVFALGWGEYLLTFLDEFTANWTLLIVAFFECIGVAWIYGLKQFGYDIQLMTGTPPNAWRIKYLMICWRFISPVVMFTLLIISFVQYGEKDSLTYDVWSHSKGKKIKKKWPLPMIIFGFILTLFIIGAIPLFAILAKFKIYPLRSEEPVPFPEDELREERKITEADDLAPESGLDKILFWGSSEELYRRRSSLHTSQMALALKSASESKATTPTTGSQKSRGASPSPSP